MIKKRNVFNIYEYDYEECWINEMARKGLLLTEYRKGFLWFEESDNTHRRYCIIPKNKEDFVQEEILLYLDEGWKPAFGFDGKTYFYTDDMDAPSLFTDEASYADYLKKNRKTYLRQTISSIFIVIVWTLIVFQNLPGNQTDISSLADKDMLSEICFFIVIAFIIGFDIVQGIGYHNCRMRISNRQSVHWTPAIYTRKRIKIILECVILAIVIAAMAPDFTGGTSKIRGEAALTYNEPYPVRLCEWSPEEWDFVSSHTDKFSWDDPKGVRYSCELHMTSNLTLKTGYSEELNWYESMNYSDWELPQYTSLTYDFRSEDTAKKLLKSQIASDMDIKRDSEEILSGMDKISFETPGADYAGYYETRSGGLDYQYLYLRKGNIVVYASYSGKRELRDSLDLFVKQLELSGEEQ